MSTSITTHVIFGVILTHDDLVKKIENPLWGKCKFDPDTGGRVTQFVVSWSIDPWDIANDTKLSAVTTGYNSDGSVVVGRSLSTIHDGAPSVSGIELMIELDTNAVHSLVSDIKNRLTVFGINVDDRKFGYYHVLNVG